MVIAREGGGSMRDAQSLLDQVLSFSGESVSEDEVAEILGFIDRSILYEVLEGALQGNTPAAIGALSKVALFGYDVRTFAEQLLEAVRNVHVVLQIRDGGDLLDLPDDEVARLQKLAAGKDSETLQRHFDVLATSVDALHRSEQPLLLLEMAVVKMSSIRPFVAVQTLVDRLEALERRIRKAGLSAPKSGGPPRPTEGRGVNPAPPPTAALPPETPKTVSEAPPPTPPPRAKAPTKPPEQATETGSVADMLLGFESSSDGSASQTAELPPSAPAEETSNEAEVTTSETSAEKPEEVHSPALPASTISEEPEVPVVVSEEASDDAVGTSSVFDLPKFDVDAFDPPKALNKAERIELPADRPDPPATEFCDATRWRRFVHRLGQQEKMGMTAAPLAMAGFAGTDGKCISLGFLSSLPMRQMDEITTSAALQDALHDEFGEGTTLAWNLDRDGKSGRSLLEELRLQRAERRAELESKASNSKAVERVQGVFPGAKIADVFLPETLEITNVR